MSRWDVAYVPLGAAAYGGAERSLVELAAGTARRGRRVLIVAGRTLAETPFAEAAAREGIEIVWCDWDPLRSLPWNLRESRSVWRDLRASVIHFNVSWRSRMWIVPVVARLSRRARLIGTMRAMPDPHGLVPRKRYLGFIPGLRLWHLPEYLAGRVWGTVLDRIVSVNAGDFPRRLERDFGVPASKLRVIHNGIRPREVGVSETLRARLRADNGIGPEDVWILFVGRVSQEKGIDPLIQSMKLLPKAYHLTVIGDGPDRPALERLALDPTLRGRISFKGFVEEPRDLMGSADIVAVPSLWYEAFGRTVVEAMSEGAPVVASRIGGMAELFQDGVEGLYVAPGDPNDLARALRRVGSDRIAARAMGAAARVRAARDYTIDRVVEEYAKLYEEGGADDRGLTGGAGGSPRADAGRR